MINDDATHLRKLGLWSILILCGLIICYLLLIAFTSVFVGLGNLEKDGSWVPVFTGINIILACLYLFTTILRFIKGKSKEQDNINLSH